MVVVPARQPISQACRYDNPMPELTLSPSQAFMNSATGEPLKKLNDELKWCHDMSGELTGPGGPDASGREHLHPPGGP
jgi:hypothetical protein